jgi:uncharacterized protein YwqG
MGFWDKIFGKKLPDKGESANRHLTKAELLVPTEVAPGLVVPKAIAIEWPNIKKAELDTVVITATRTDKPALRQSTFGYYPCLPKGYEYPRDGEGNYMYPLAQLNLSEMPRIEGYPESGYLQFYIGTSDCYGLSFDETPSSFAVLYFEEHELDEIETDFSFLGDILQTDYTPVHYPHTLSFTTKREYISTNDHRTETDAALALEHLTARYPQIAAEIEDFFFENFDNHGHKLGGYAYFTQYDKRAENEKISEYVLLFQMDSDDDIMWGDCGVGNFFIHPDKLAQRDFSEVYYSWDCS